MMSLLGNMNWHAYVFYCGVMTKTMMPKYRAPVRQLDLVGLGPLV